MSLAPADSSRRKNESSGTCFDAWNIMCSKRWAKPVRPAASLAGPTWYHVLTATTGSSGRRVTITCRPLGSVNVSTATRGTCTGAAARLVAGAGAGFCADEVTRLPMVRTAMSRARIEGRLDIDVSPSEERYRDWP